MEQQTDRLYPSGPFENKKTYLQQKLEKKLNDVNSFINSTNNTKEMITHFIDKNNKSKKNKKIWKTLTAVLNLFDTIVTIATTKFFSLSLTGIGLLAIPISTATACWLLIGNKVIHETIINKCIIYEKQYERDQQTIKSFDNFYWKSLQDNLIGKTEYDSLCINFTKYVDEIENE